MTQVAVVGFGLAGLALTVPTFAASSGQEQAATKEWPADFKRAKERCCLVELEGPARTVTAGGAPAELDLVVSRAGNGCTQTQRTITVRLEGLAARHVRVERVVSGQPLALRDTSSAAGTVEVVDPLVDSKLICGADTSVAASYRIAFLDGTPLGRAELVVAAQTVSGKLLDTATASTRVVEAVRTSEPPPPETTPPGAPAAPEAPAPSATEEPGAPETVAPPVQDAPAPPATPPTRAVARPPLDRASDTSTLSSTLLTASIVLAFSAMALLGVLWRLRRRSRVLAADEAPTAPLPAGIGAELARLTEDREAADPTRPAAP